jgi:hypothetical protein
LSKGDFVLIHLILLGLKNHSLPHVNRGGNDFFIDIFQKAIPGIHSLFSRYFRFHLVLQFLSSLSYYQIHTKLKLVQKTMSGLVSIFHLRVCAKQRLPLGSLYLISCLRFFTVAITVSDFLEISLPLAGEG